MEGIHKIAVIGAGNMGSGIAQKIAQEGFQVMMVDRESRFVEKGLMAIQSLLAEAVERKIFDQKEVARILTRITGTTDLDTVKDADLIIEAVFEDMAVKKGLFKTLDGICKPATIFASNTSSFSISELAIVTSRPDRFIGLHFFYQPAKNRLLEIIPGQKTDKETTRLCRRFSDSIGKIAILVKDATGFAINRYFVPWLNEAVRLLQEGVANIASIDEAAKRTFKIGLGPFELMNVTGVPIAYHSASTLGEAFGSYYEPGDRLRDQAERGQAWDLSGEIDESRIPDIQDRLLSAVFLAAVQAAEEGIATISDIDLGAKIGLRWRMGPFELMNRMGMARSYELVQRVVSRHKDLEMPKLLTKQHESGALWDLRYVDISIDGAIATITLNRPEAMNALNETVVHQLDEAFTRAETNPDVRAIVFCGAGKAFVAGADVGFFIKSMKDRDLGRIQAFTEMAQGLFNRIDKSSKWVAAKLDGLALGGGAELALVADTIVATDKGAIGFPETGLGIYPGLGGTQRLPRYVGKKLAKYLIFTGKVVDSATAMAMGLVEYLVERHKIDQSIRELALSEDRLTKAGRARTAGPASGSYEPQAGREARPDPTPTDPAISNKLKEIKRLFSDDYLKKILSGEGIDPEETLALKMVKVMSRKAPLAVQSANRLIEDGLKGSLEDGLRLELAQLKSIFSTQDAWEGLTALGKREPSFKGA